MSEPTTGPAEPTKAAEGAQPEVIQKDLPTAAARAVEESGDDSVTVEPQNDVTKKFTDSEWKSIKELRVSSNGTFTK